MDGWYSNNCWIKKKGRNIDRNITTALFILRCKECGILLSELKLLSIGFIFDMLSEKNNDQYDYPVLATQADIDRL